MDPTRETDSVSSYLVWNMIFPSRAESFMQMRWAQASRHVKAL